MRHFTKIPHCAQDRIRTGMFLQTLRPEHSASTNFATWAVLKFKRSKIKKSGNPSSVLYHLFLKLNNQ